MSEPRILVLFPPVSVARDFIDYPYFADLGAVQLASVLSRKFKRARVDLLDAFALPGARLRWREDGRAHLGIEVEALLAAIDEQLEGMRSPDDIYDPIYDAVVVAYTPFHRPPTRDDVLNR